MPQILAEQIHYSVADMEDALDKIRQFAVAQGWTQDYWDTSTGDRFLQLWSRGFSLQDMCYRFRETNYDASDDRLEYGAVIPGKRFDQSGDKLTNASTIWSPVTPQFNGARMPATTFTALYLYGNKNFISCIFHVDPISVVTMQFGTLDLSLHGATMKVDFSFHIILEAIQQHQPIHGRTLLPILLFGIGDRVEDKHNMFQ
jgi:hypothetical protein